MELTNEFVIDRGVEETWKILNDLEFIAPCMPGAQLQEIEGDEYRGVVKIKVGPITAQYKGKASFVEQDEANKVARLKAEGRDPRQGNANAMVTAKMAPAGDNQTTVNINTDLSLSGKIASFGRGAIEDVSKKILGQFSDNLQAKLENEPSPGQSSTGASAGATDETSTWAPPPTPPAETRQPATPTSSSSTEPATPTSPSAPTSSSAPESATTSGAGNGSTVSGSDAPTPSRPPVRKIDAPEAEPVDLLAVGGESMAKRAIPAAGGLAIVLIILYWLLGGRE